MEFKFDTDTLNRIAGNNTPEKIASRLLELRTRYVTADHEARASARFVAELRKRLEAEKVIRKVDYVIREEEEAASYRRTADRLAAEIAADEERLMTLVLDGKTALPRE